MTFLSEPSECFFAPRCYCPSPRAARKNPNGEDSRKEVGGADSAEGAEGMETVTGSESDGFGGVLGTEIAAADYEMTDEAAVNPYIGFAVDAESKDAASGIRWCI